MSILKNNEFLTALVKIDHRDILVSFLTEILTDQELVEIDRRVKIAHMLLDGLPQRVIAKELQCSVTTVSRISRVIKFEDGGLKAALKKD